ncbi:hypothetical protein ACLHDF_30390 [Priestia aryabhattai]|uniref:hypothetical protein n=1 Tax=Priestia megaterium TaxID=1404 RepID=UPI0039B8AE91
MKKVLQSLTVTSLVLGGGSLFGFSEQASAAGPQSSKVEMEKSEVGHKASGISTEQGERKLSTDIGIQTSLFYFYDYRDFEDLFFTMTPGSSKNFLGDAQDDISSISIPPHSYIILYSDLNYEGHQVKIENDESSYLHVDLEDYYFDETDIDCNNSVGSLRTGRIY